MRVALQNGRQRLNGGTGDTAFRQCDTGAWVSLSQVTKLRTNASPSLHAHPMKVREILLYLELYTSGEKKGANYRPFTFHKKKNNNIRLVGTKSGNMPSERGEGLATGSCGDGE